MTDRELMQQALDALEGYARNCRCEGGGAPCDAAEALRARLAQPEQEIESDQDHVEEDGCPTEKAVLQRFWREHQMQEPVFWATNTLAHEWMVTKEKVANDSIPLYTAPPQREWQGLTPEEAKEISMANRPYVVDMIAALEARLKEKNCE